MTKGHQEIINVCYEKSLILQKKNISFKFEFEVSVLDFYSVFMWVYTYVHVFISIVNYI